MRRHYWSRTNRARTPDRMPDPLAIQWPQDAEASYSGIGAGSDHGRSEPAMAKKRDNASELAEKLLHALEAQRSRDREAYPLTIQQLAELAEPHVPWKLVERAIVTTSFSERACVALKKNPGAPVALSEDLEQLAAFPHLLVVTLEAVCTPARPAQPLNRMASKLDARLR